jgi:hypothetical protein
MKKKITVIKRGFWVFIVILGIISLLIGTCSERSWIKFCLIILSFLLIPIGVAKIWENEHTIVVRFLEVKKHHGGKDL